MPYAEPTILAVRCASLAADLGPKKVQKAANQCCWNSRHEKSGRTLKEASSLTTVMPAKPPEIARMVSGLKTERALILVVWSRTWSLRIMRMAVSFERPHNGEIPVGAVMCAGIVSWPFLATIHLSVHAAIPGRRL
jgi:hypothetical protein